MTVGDNTIQAGGLVNFFKNLERSPAKAGNKLANNVLKNPGRSLELTSNNATAGVSGNPKIVFSTLPEMIDSFHTGKGLYLEEKFLIVYHLN